MSADIVSVPVPHRHHSVDQVIGTMTNLHRDGEMDNCVVVSETSDGIIFLSAGSGEPMTSAQCLWVLERAKSFLLDVPRQRWQAV